MYALLPGIGRGSEVTNHGSGRRLGTIRLAAHRGRAYADQNGVANVPFGAR